MADDDVLDEIDHDLAAARANRHDAWLTLVVRDSPTNRARFDAASAAIDDLLDLRNDVLAAERMVTS